MAFLRAEMIKVRKHKDDALNLIGVSVAANIVDSDAGITETPTYGMMIDGDTLDDIIAITGGAAKKAAFRVEIKSQITSIYDDWVISRDAALPAPNELSDATITTEFGSRTIT